MADKKISALSAASLPLAGTEVLPIVQSGSTVKVSSDDLTVKNVRSNATTGLLQIAGPAAGATRVMTTPDANFTVARTDAAQSFTGNQTLSDGNLVVGTAGKGIDFSANANAPGMTSELLTWYEVGTFTPTVYGSSTAGTQTYAWQHGNYTRVGNVVTCVVSVRVATTSGMVGNISIGGLPFTSKSGALYAGGVQAIVWGNLTAGQVYIAGYVSPSANYATLTGSTGATGNLVGLDAANFGAGSYVDLIITYMAA